MDNLTDNLAHIQFLDDTGRDCDCRASDVVRVREHPGGSMVYFQDGTTIGSNNTVTEIHNLIDVLWTEKISGTPT